MIAPRRFWTLLAVVVACTMLALWVWNLLLPASEGISWFTLICVAIFVMINVLAYYAGRHAAWSTSRYRFIHFTMLLMMLKMAVCIVMVVVHMQVNAPESRLFVLPFFTIYLIFTAAELYVLDKIARTKSPRS